MRKMLLSSCAIAIVAVATIGSANAGGLSFGDKTYNTGIGVGVGVGVGKGGKGGNGGDATINQGDTKYKVPAQAPGVFLAQPGVGAAVTSCFLKGMDDARAIGLGVGTGAQAVPSAGLGYAYSTTEENYDLLCANGNAAQHLNSMGYTNSAAKTMCADPFARRGLQAQVPGFCDGLPLISNYVIALDDGETVQLATVAPVSAPKTADAPAAPKPLGNAVAGRCANGFDYNTGQCASDYAGLTDG